MIKVLLFDNDRLRSVVLKKDLEVCGFKVAIRHDGTDALNIIVKNTPDIILANFELPIRNGFDIVSDIRKLNISTPVLLLSSNNNVDEAVHSFDVGANDYIRKPIELRELLARINYNLPKNKQVSVKIEDDAVLNVSGVKFDFISNVIIQEENCCQLTKMQASIIRLLLQNKGEIVPFDNILSSCFNNNSRCYYDAMNCLKVVISKLRRNLYNSSITSLRIETYRKRGICLYI
ncbi:MAG: response regulator transcription factor [Candidatus Limimorpha sp.]